MMRGTINRRILFGPQSEETVAWSPFDLPGLLAFL